VEIIDFLACLCFLYFVKDYQDFVYLVVFLFSFLFRLMNLNLSFFHAKLYLHIKAYIIKKLDLLLYFLMMKQIIFWGFIRKQKN